MNREFFSPEFIRSLDRLAFVARRMKMGSRSGRYRSLRRGKSLEFNSFRPYIPGDEVRHIDLNHLRRRNRLFVKEFEAEEELNVYLLLDASESMRFGGIQKFELCRRLTAALAYISLKSGNSSGMGILRQDGERWLPPGRGRGALPRIFSLVEKEHPFGGTCLNHSLRKCADRITRPGLVILLSDFLDPLGFEEGLGRLSYAGNELMVLRITEEQEHLEQNFKPGEYRLQDAETGKRVPVSITQSLLNQYRKELAEFDRRIRRFCYLNESTFLSFPSDTPFETVVLRYLTERRAVG